MAFCLPPKFSAAFLKGLKDGTISPEKLMDMTSQERRDFFSGIIGEENAREVNALFESKLLLKDQQRGLINWAKAVAGISDAVRRDLLSKIQKMDKILQPNDADGFLSDLAAKKLGVEVTPEEATQIFEASKAAASAKDAMLQDMSNVDKRIAYGRAIMDMSDKIESFKPNGRTFVEKAIDVLNIPKSALTSILHFSAPFVQGWGMLSTARAWEAFGQMFKYFANEENYKNLNAYIISHPDYPLAKDGKLGITKLGDKLSAREEAIQSTLVEQANKYLTDKMGVPNLVRASSRAFTGYLNYVRFNRFTDLLNAARMAGEDVRAGTPAVRDLAKVVNDFTGRGAIGVGDKYAQVTPALNAAFFSPRKLSATIQMFNPVRYVPNVARETIGLEPISPTAQKAAVRQLLGSLIATSTVLALAKAVGAEVDPDPRSQSFAKIKIGDEKLDLSGGNSIYLRLLARIATNQEITSKGKLIDLGQGYKPTTRADLVAQYMRGKLSPVAGALADALYGTDPVGRPFSVTQEARDKLMPITMSSFLNYAQNDPDNTAAIFPSLAALFGVGLESPLPPPSKQGMNVWGQSDQVSSSTGDLADKELKRLGYTVNFPPQTIRGVKLTDQQYADYIRISGRLIKSRLDELIGSDMWNAASDNLKSALVKKTVSSRRRAAQTAVMMQSQNTGNDIAAQARERKRISMGFTPAEETAEPVQPAQDTAQ